MAMTADLIDRLAARFALLGDPTRLRILHVLIDRGELSVHEIAAAAGTSRFNASAHLNRLLAAGLVARRRQAASVNYRIADESLPLVCDRMCASLRGRPAPAVASETALAALDR